MSFKINQQLKRGWMMMAALKLDSCANVKAGVRWGYALGWYGDFGVSGDSDTMAKLKFLSRYNFKSTHIGLKLHVMESIRIHNYFMQA